MPDTDSSTPQRAPSRRAYHPWELPPDLRQALEQAKGPAEAKALDYLMEPDPVGPDKP